MFLSFVRHVRRQPKAVRNQYAFIFALIFTASVGAVWLYGNIANSGSGDFAVGEEAKNSAPFASLFKQVKEQWATAKEAVKDESVATSTEALPDSREMILSEETLAEKANSGMSDNQATSSEVMSPVKESYIEVQIATTSSGTSTIDIEESGS